MPISIDNQQTELLVQKLADLTHETPAEIIQRAVADQYWRACQERSGRSLADELNEIALRCSALPIISNLTEDEILGYDEWGAPTRTPPGSFSEGRMVSAASVL